MEFKELGCPKCNAHLEIEDVFARCADCGVQYAVEDGVICTDREDVFMGEFDPSRMRQFTEAAREMGWRRAVQELMVGEDSSTATILLDPHRASFISLLDSSKRQSILDLGAGMGAISQQLAKSFDRVYALDLAFERLAFLQTVAGQEKADGIRSLCHRDVLHLPFQSGVLDAAVMIGVFEYFPLSYPKETLLDVQHRALAELHRVMSPGGQLLIGTKNRFGWPYWGGALDSSHLRFGSLMPRWMANGFSRALLKRPYRIITDSFNGYTKLLREAGFEEPKFYWPVDGYQKSQAWIELSDHNAIREAIRSYTGSELKKTALSGLSATGLFKHFVPHFGILTRKAA